MMRVFAAFCLLALLSSCTAKPIDRSPAFTAVPVYFGTDRAAAEEGSAHRHYSAERSEEMSYGRAGVSIPARRDAGEFGLLHDAWGIKISESAEKHIVITRVEKMGKEGFFNSLGYAGAGKPLLVFIHGYNVSFDHALRRAAQMAHDIGYPGPVVLFSWPSHGLVTAYPYDATNAQWAAADLGDFLRDVAEKTGAAEIDVIAHSMGNQPLLEALRHLGSGKNAPRFREIVLTAPDIDAGIFRRAVPEILKQARRVTLYASSNDEALQASRKFNGHARAGDAGAGIVVVPGIDTVDASKADTSLLGHSYFGDSRSVLDDMRALLEPEPRPPLKRPGMTRVVKGDVQYWQLSP